TELVFLSPRLADPVPADLAAVQCIALPAAPKGAAATRERRLLATNTSVARLLDSLAPLDLVYERHALFAHGAMEWALAHDVPSVLEVNAPLLAEQARHRTLARPAEAQASTRRAMVAARAVSAVTSEVANYARDHGARRVHVIANAVNPDRFPPHEQPAEPFTVGFLGTLKPWHDVPTLIDAFARLRARHNATARLLLVGDGPERSTLEARLAAHDLTAAAEFTGAVMPAEVPGQLARMPAAGAPS